jgi:hypothetical protein
MVSVFYAENVLEIDKTLEHPFNINVVDVLTSDKADNSLSLLKVQALISSMVPKWKTGSIKDTIEMTCGLDTEATSSIMSFKTAMVSNNLWFLNRMELDVYVLIIGA